MKEQLTAKQKKVFDFIKDHIRSENVPPTVREIAARFGYASPGTVQDYLRILKDRGLINIKKNFYRGIELLVPAFGIPVLGRIRAGAPEHAVEDIEEWIDVSGLFPRDNDVFALRVMGDSMEGSGIMEGDLAVVKKQPSAGNNDIVVALMEDEATIKRFKSRGNNVWLEPDNPRYEPIRERAFSVIGKVVGIIRNY